MTIASTTNKASYNGAGSAGPFTIPFYFIADADISVVKVSSAGVETTLTITTDYTLTGAGNPSGGAVTLVAVLAVGEKLVIKRSPAQVQEIDYVENSAFPAASHEMGLDRLTMMVQDLQEQVDRAVKVDLSSATAPDDLLDELAADVAAAAASAATATTQAGLAEDAKDAAVVAQGLAEDAQAAAEAVSSKVRISADDTTPDYLETKLILASNSGLVLATTYAGGDERRTIGIDLDTSPALVIGAGGIKVDTGTTEGKVPTLSAGGALILPGQPAFFAAASADIANVTGDGTAYAYIGDSEVFDQGDDFNNSTGVFTAPLTGKYRFTASISVDSFTSSHTNMNLQIITSNRTYGGPLLNPYAVQSSTGLVCVNMTCIADMDAGDTAYPTITVSNGTKVVRMRFGTLRSSFGGDFLC